MCMEPLALADDRQEVARQCEVSRSRSRSGLGVGLGVSRSVSDSVSE